MFTTIEKTDISYLEKILLHKGAMVPVPFDAIKDVPQNDISLFCHKHAIYQVVTTELVALLKQEINGYSAIEIGAGNGCLGRALKIPITDNCMQEWKEIQILYESLKQPVIKYPKDIIRLDAHKAIAQYKPEIIVGAWVTQKYKAGFSDGNLHGIEEDLFKGKANKYLFVGNEHTHGTKEILRKFSYRKFKFDWLVSRSMQKDKNVIYIFNL